MFESLVDGMIHLLSNLLSKEGIIFVVSTLPILELRGGVLVGYLLDVPLITTSILSVIANLLPIPFVLFFIEKVFIFMEKHNILVSLVHKLKERASHKSASIKNAEFIGLMLFVGIPLPGTGAWTGALIAELLQIDRKKAMLAISFGVLLALLIMLVLSYGLLNQLGF